MTSKVCVVIPAYNAAETIGPVIRGALKHVPRVFVADDGSIDRTARNAAAQGAEVLPIGRNKGKGHALKVLFERAVEQGFDAVISMDADGQHDPEEIPRFIAAHAKAPGNIIVGSRMGEQEKIPRARYNSMHVARFFISVAANQFVEDTQCGFRLYPLALIRQMKLTQGRYVTESEILMKAGDMGALITPIDIGAIYGNYVSHFRPVMDVAFITAYIISYLMLKFAVEGLVADKVFTYSKNSLRDLIAGFRTVDRAFKIVTVLTIMPATVLFWLMSLLLPPFIGNNYAAMRRLNHSFFEITLATNMLPLILVIIIIERLASRLGFEFMYIDDFVQRFYPHLWASEKKP